MFSGWDASERCIVPGVGKDEVLLSNLPCIPPGWGLLLEVAIVFMLARKLLLDRKLQLWYFDHLRMKYKSMDVIHFGLAMVILQLTDCAVYAVLRPTWRLGFIARSGFFLILPEVQRLGLCISTVIGEIVFIAVFYVSTIIFFAWIALTIFKDVDGTIFGHNVNEGLDSFANSLNTIFVAGSTEEFVECFQPSYTAYRASGILWLLFLVVVQLLLLSLVLDTIVAAYMKHQEHTDLEVAIATVRGIVQAFHELVALEPPQLQEDKCVSKVTFLEFVAEYSRSPANRPISPKNADILFKAIDVDGSGLLDCGEFCNICGVIDYQFWVTKENSPVEDVFPRLWKSKPFVLFRTQVNKGNFDLFMDYVLLVNLTLILYETYCDMNNVKEPHVILNLELGFSLVYVMEVGLTLCVKSFGSYWSSRSNQFDFCVTWLLLASSVLDDMVSATGAGNLKRYMNILRLMRLLRMVKQLKRFQVVQRMVETISSLVKASEDILKVLGIVVFCFSMLSVQLWGGLLYKSNPALEETEYKEKNFFVLNFNDFPMAFGVYVVMLLCEYVPIFPEAISKVSNIRGSWLVFLIFYILGVSIVFELVKAFTIDVFMDLRSKWGAEKEEFETLHTVIEECRKNREELHYREAADPRRREKIEEAIHKIEEMGEGIPASPTQHAH